MKKEFKLEDVPGDEVWILSWVGGAHKKQYEYFFDAAFYQVNDISNLYRGKSIDFSSQKRVKLDSSVAQLIRIGSIWKDKKLLFDYTSFETNSIEDLILPHNTVTEIKPLNNLIDPDDIYYPIPYDLRDALCISVKSLKKDKNKEKDAYEKIDIIIPCFELARRYFFVNETITSTLIGQKGMLEDLYVKKATKLRSDEHTGELKPFVKFGQAIYKRDIKADLAKAVISEIAFNESFKKAAKKIGQKIFDYSSQSQTPHIHVSLPFKEEIEFKTKGKWFKCQTTDNWKYIVFEIISDNYKYMYNYYDFNLFLDKRSKKDVDRSKLTPTTSNVRKQLSYRNEEDEVAINLSEPSSHNSDEKFIEVPEEERNLPSFERVKKKTQKTKAVHLTRSVTNADEYSTRASRTTKTDKTIGKAILQIEKGDKFESTTLAEFEKVLKFMSKDGFRFKNITLNEQCSPFDNLHYSIFPTDIIQDSKTKNWCRREYIKGKGWKGFRRIAVVETQYFGRFFYLLEIEPRSKGESFYTAITSGDNGAKLIDEKVNSILKALAKVRGQWSNFDLATEFNNSFSKDFHLETQCHFKTSTPEKMARKFTSKMESFL